MVMAAALATIAAPRVVRAEGTLAVFRIDPLGVSAEIVARLEALLRMELGRLADAALPSPGQIQRLVARHRKLSGCTGGVHCLARAGALLKVKRIISGNVGGLGDSYVLNIKLVDVGAKKEVRRIQETMSGHPDQLIEAVRVAAYRLVAPERLRGSLEVLANVAGATVALDGKELGATPLAIQHNLLVGEHTLRVTKAGYSDVLQEIKVRLQKSDPCRNPRFPPRNCSARKAEPQSLLRVPSAFIRGDAFPAGNGCPLMDLPGRPCACRAIATGAIPFSSR